MRVTVQPKPQHAASATLYMYRGGFPIVHQRNEWSVSGVFVIHAIGLCVYRYPNYMHVC